MAFDEDLTAFFDTDEFADVAVFTPAAGGESFNVTGIFDSGYLLAAIKDAQVATDKPRLTCRSVDVATVERGDTCVIKGLTLDVLDVEHDGTGMALVVMNR